MIGNTLKKTAVIIVSALLLSCGQGQKKGQGMIKDSDVFGKGQGANTQLTAGIPNVGPTEQKAIETVNQELKETVPESGIPDFSPAVNQMVDQMYKAEKAGQDTTQLRYQIMGKMLVECADQVSKYTPSPGETYLGKWGYTCTASAFIAGWNVNGTYSAYDSAGIPLGNPTISYVGIAGGSVNGTTVVGGGKGQISADASGKGQAVGDWYATYSGGTANWVWTCSLSDQPAAASGQCVPSNYTEECPVAIGALSVSQNPIPKKYDEGIKKMGACYRKAMTLTSPILWKYMSSLSPSAQQTLKAAMLLQ